MYSNIVPNPELTIIDDLVLQPLCIAKNVSEYGAQSIITHLTIRWVFTFVPNDTQDRLKKKLAKYWQNVFSIFRCYLGHMCYMVPMWRTGRMVRVGRMG